MNSEWKENGWVKVFTDGKKEYGWDNLVKLRQASWSKGRLDKILLVTLKDKDYQVTIQGEGNYWQSDTFEAKIFTKGKRTNRTIYRQIKANDIYVKFHQSDKALYVDFNIYGDIPLKLEWVDKWFALTITEDSKILWNIVETPDGTISRKV